MIVNRIAYSVYLICGLLITTLLSACAANPNRGVSSTPTIISAVLPSATAPVVQGSAERPTQITPTQAIPTTVPTETQPAPTEVVPTKQLEPVTVGPVEMTGEEYALLHTQNISNNKTGEMIDSSVYQERNNLILTIRQRLMEKLAAQIGADIPNNDLQSYINWLYQLKADKKIDEYRFQEFLSNMMITNGEIETLVENRGPVIPDIDSTGSTKAGLNYGAEELLFSANLPDGTTVDVKVPQTIQGKVVAMVPLRLIPGESIDMYNIGVKSYTLLGDDSNKLFGIMSVADQRFGDKQYSDFGNNGKDELKMPSKWAGYQYFDWASAASAFYYQADSRNTWHYIWDTRAHYHPVLSQLTGKYARFMWFTYLVYSFNIDPNGVIGTVGTGVVITEK